MECVVDSCGNVQHEALLVMMEDEDELEENDLRDEEDEEEPIVNTNPKTKNHGRNEANDDIDVEVDYLIEEFEDDDETVLQLGGGIGGNDEEESEKPPTTITTKKKAVTFSDEEIQAFRDQVSGSTSGSNEENIPPEYAAAAAAASGGGEGTVSAIPLASVLLSRTRSPFKSRKKEKKAIPADTASTSDWRPPMSKPPSKVEMPPPQRERPIKKIQKLFPTASKRKVKQAPPPPPSPIKEEDSYKEDNTIAESVVVMQGDDELLEGTSKRRQSKVKVFEITVFPNQRLGLTVHSYGFIKEVFATSIFKNEINARTDQVIEVNGIDLSKKESDEILKTLQSLDPVKPKIFKLKRENPAYMTIQESHMVDQEEDVAQDMKYNILADLRSKYLCDFGEIPWELRF